MNLAGIALFAVLGLTSAAIFFQDLKERQVSLWILLLFGLNVVLSVLYLRSWEVLLLNALAATLYVGLNLLLLKVYFRFRSPADSAIIDRKLGKADVLVFLFTGLTFSPAAMIFFFCFALVCSLLWFLVSGLVQRAEAVKTIPLAGLFVFFHVIAIIVLNLVHLEPSLIDCSFLIYE